MAEPKRYTLLIIAAIVIIAAGVSARLYQLTSIKFDIDLMADGLQPIKQHLTGATKIGYDTDRPSDDLYNEVAFTVAPVVLSKSAGNDTVLYIQNNGSPPKDHSEYQVITKSAAQHYQFILLKKKR